MEAHKHRASERASEQPTLDDNDDENSRMETGIESERSRGLTHFRSYVRRGRVESTGRLTRRRHDIISNERVPLRNRTGRKRRKETDKDAKEAP